MLLRVWKLNNKCATLISTDWRVAHPFALSAKEPALSGVEGVGFPTASRLGF